MRPVSPYAVAKAASFWMTRNYRTSYGIFACTGLLSNHESPLRPSRFVTSKIVSGVRAIRCGKQKRISLGNTLISRDWGWAADYVDAIHRIATAPSANDYVVATGETHSLREFITCLCDLAGLQFDEIIETNADLLRPAELMTMHVSPARILSELNWRATTSFPSMLSKLLNEKLF